jgi:hypothetical protein
MLHLNTSARLPSFTQSSALKKTRLFHVNKPLSATGPRFRLGYVRFETSSPGGGLGFAGLPFAADRESRECMLPMSRAE